MALTRILGVDPGLTRCGVGVIDKAAGRQVSLVLVDVLRSSAEAELPDRIGLIGAQIEKLLDLYKPQLVAIERVYAEDNLASVMGVAQISGVVIFLAQRRGIPVVLHTPTEVKAAVTGNGKADKAQVGNMVARILGLESVPKPADAADALAIAICSAWRGPGAGVGVTADGTATKAQATWQAALKASQGKPK